jgi:Protein of unknown function (DUF1538).
VRHNLLEKLKEALSAVLPISIIVVFLHMTIAPMPIGTIMLFLSGNLFLIIGMAIFSLGVDAAMMPIGELIGSALTKTRQLPMIIISCFILGVAVTGAEPDLQVLTKQVSSIPDMVLIVAVAGGVGIFLVMALLRMIFDFSLAYMFIILYALVFIVAIFAKDGYMAVAFDAGGVTTGPITVPFILALGSGVSTVKGGKDKEEDSFGLCSICSVGPVLSVLILGMFFNPETSDFAEETVTAVSGLGELLTLYGKKLIEFGKEVGIVLVPILVIFAYFQVAKLKLHKRQLIKIGVGVIYTFVGLIIFLTGVNVGFMPIGTYLGSKIGALSYSWILFPLSAVMGFFIVAAEPAVHVLNKQVEDITAGAISKNMMMIGISLGVAKGLMLAMIRIIFSVNIWYFLLPGYLIALGLTFFTPKIFTAIAFDSGGVASGTMAAAFLLPFAMGASASLGGNPDTDAFGIIAMVAMMPLVSIQIMGVIYNIKLKRLNKLELEEE